MENKFPVLVLGIGNLLWADEGFGVRAVEALSRDFVLRDQVTVMDGGTQGLYLLPYVQAAQRMIVFDAVDYALPPGTLKLVRNADIPAYLGVRKMSLHQSSFQEVLSLAYLTGRHPRAMLLIGVQPADVSDYGGSLSEVVRARLPEALAIAAQTLAEWGAPLQPRGTDTFESAELPADASLAIEAYEAGRPSADEACRIGDARVLAHASGMMQEPR
jgi:hydrogenase maturation protease